MTPNVTAPILPPAAAAAKVLALIAEGAKALTINAAKAELALALAIA